MRATLASLTLVAALVCVGAASAGHATATWKGGNVRYSFLGQLTTTPSNGGVSINVEGGNRRALRAMLGAPVTQTFAYGTTTEFLKWSHGVPAIVQAGDLAAGDFVWVHVRAPRHTTLAGIEQQPAALVGDHGAQLFKPTQPLYLFRGTLSSVGTSTVSVHVTGGNARALRLLVGQSSDESLAFGANTIFLLWQGKVPTVIDATKLVAGDRIVVRIRAPKGSTLAQVAATPANHIGDREPPSAK